METQRMATPVARTCRRLLIVGMVVEVSALGWLVTPWGLLALGQAGLGLAMAWVGWMVGLGESMGLHERDSS